MTYRDLLYEVTDNIATITLNRPERLNAISGGMLASFSEAFREADADRDVRAIILTGAGRGFCSGPRPEGAGREREQQQRQRRAAACRRSSTWRTARPSSCTRRTSR